MKPTVNYGPDVLDDIYSKLDGSVVRAKTYFRISRSSRIPFSYATPVR